MFRNERAGVGEEKAERGFPFLKNGVILPELLRKAKRKKRKETMKSVKVGIIGFGTVGAGVADCLLKNGDLLRSRLGVNIELASIADLDIVTDRGVAVPEGILTTDADRAIEQSDVVVELIGGTTVAKTMILKALLKGKTVVTANKALLADHGPELFAAAEANGASVWYEASVGGGIPIIKSLREGFAGNRVNRMYGILNGTCNYILTRMEREGLGFEEVLKDAQRLGYAEANPSLDIDGFDTAHKAAILASIAYGGWFTTKDVHVEGIRNVTLADVRNADCFGCKIKLLAIVKRNEDGRIELRVHPALVPKTALIAKIDDVFNGVMVNGDFVGDALFYGRGAGRMATASAVVGDIADAALDFVNKTAGRTPSHRKERLSAGLIPMKEIRTRYYMRIVVADKVGTLGKLATALGNHGISISRIVQADAKDQDSVPVIIATHEAVESDVQAAKQEMEQLPEVRGEACIIRIEEL